MKRRRIWTRRRKNSSTTRTNNILIKQEILDSLPAAEISGKVNSLLGSNSCIIITAAPGAGKSTLIPLTMLQGCGFNGKILMLEPRRLAARQVAERMAHNIGEAVGQTVGYRMRFESRVSKQTRIEVLTEGILARMLSDDPGMEGVSAVIFDEFHERSLQSDLSLALVREVQSLLRPDLKIVIMSATIDSGELCSALGAPSVESEGRMYPVEILHLPGSGGTEEVARAIRKAHSEHDGDILAFLPGEAEIRKCSEMLGQSLEGTRIMPLYGMLPPDEQRKAISPSPDGERKAVLATSIAETSLTIEGVRIVVDSGLCRKMVFDPRNSMSHLETVRISRDMAVQRAGRAGRTAPGVCYRLWSEASETRMAEARVPEILEADLTSAMLAAASFGTPDFQKLQWLTAPPKQNTLQAKALLQMMNAVTPEGKLTGYGHELAGLPCHPRIAGMLLCAKKLGVTGMAADIAAILEEKDVSEDAGADIGMRLQALHSGRGPKFERIRKASDQYLRLTGSVREECGYDPYKAGLLLASAYPERISKATGCGNFTMVGGEQVCLDRQDPLSGCDWLAVAEANVRKGEKAGRIFMAAPLDSADLGGMTRERDIISWDAKEGCVTALHEKRIGSLLVEACPLPDPDREEIRKVICEAAARYGTSMLDFSDEVADLQRRIAAVSQWHPELELPDLGTEQLLKKAGEWLGPYIGNSSRASELKKIDLRGVLWGMLSYEQQREVDRISPSHIVVPTGSRIKLEYRQGADKPVLKVRLQECFGMEDTPAVDGGKRPVLMELLSPGYKPVQLTSDLKSFWKSTYFEVRKELRRRYPKHYWPDSPLEAQAVRGVRKDGHLVMKVKE